ncbi:MAG: MFS transporter [Promethearchaeota archaeon]
MRLERSGTTPKPTDGSEPEVLPASAKVAYGLTNAGSQFLAGLGLGAIDLFYLKATPIDPLVMSWSWMAFIAWNMLNDPLIGILQERTKSKLGRRVPYLRYGSIVYVVSFLLIWFPTSVKSLLFWNHFFMLFTFDTIYSTIGLVTYSLPAEMAVTSKERGKLMTISAGLSSIGVVGSILLPLHYLTDPPDVGGFRVAVVVLGIGAGVLIYASSYFIKENAYAQMEGALGFVESIKETVKNKPFLVLEVAIFAMVVMQNTVVGNLAFLADYVFTFEFNALNVALFAALVLIVGYSVAWVNRGIAKYGLKRVTIWGALLGAAGFGLLALVALPRGVTAANKLDFSVVALPLGLVAVGLINYMITNQPLMADAIDYDETRTGKRRETTYSGVNALFTKPAVSIGHALFLWILKAYGYVEGDVGVPAPPPSQQPATVATGVVLGFTLVPFVCLLIGALALRWYSLDGPEWDATKARLREVHAKKERKFLESLGKGETGTRGSRVGGDVAAEGGGGGPG